MELISFSAIVRRLNCREECNDQRFQANAANPTGIPLDCRLYNAILNCAYEGGAFHLLRKAITSSGPSTRAFSNSPPCCAYSNLPSLSRTAMAGIPFAMG